MAGIPGRVRPLILLVNMKFTIDQNVTTHKWKRLFVAQFSRALLLDQLPPRIKPQHLRFIIPIKIILLILISEPKIIQHADVMTTCIILIACHSRNYYTFTTSISVPLGYSMGRSLLSFMPNRFNLVSALVVHNRPTHHMRIIPLPFVLASHNDR